MDLFNRYGLIAAAGDRHLAEFMPGDKYLKNPETVEEWGFALTSVAWRKEDLKRRLARSARLVSGEEQIELVPTGEEGILLIKALCGLTRVVSNVNIPNAALQIPNLPADAVVETNALFGRDSIRPVYAGAMPDNVRELVMPHIRNHERILEAAKTRDEELVVRSFMEDPVVMGSHASEDDIRKLVRDMMTATLK
jgi:alpha-galactosidase